MKSLSASKNFPRLLAFGQLGYGKPGLNMFREGADTWYYAGARLTWNIWNWGQVSREKQIAGIQSEIILTQKETFELNLRTSLELEKSDINKYEELVKSDNQIIELRNRIVKASSSQLENGTLSYSDYLTDLNNVTQAKLNREIHKIMLERAKVNYMVLCGKL
jgi:outer membrane protein TolC